MSIFHSIKIKLFLWFFSTFSFILTIIGFFLYHELKGIVIGSVDSHLHSETQFIANLLEVEKGKIELELQEASIGEYTVPFSGHYYQITSGRGDILVKSPSLATASLPSFHGTPLLFDAPLYETVVGPKGEPIRLISQLFKLPAGMVAIQAAEGLNDAYNIIYSFRNIILAIFFGVFVLSGVGGIMIAQVSLRPLDAFSKTIRLITEKSLNDRIDTGGIDKELIQLAKAFNTTLGRLEQSFLRQRRFLSDASHELRTPTSVIKSYCDVTLKKERSVAEYQDALKVIDEVAAKMGRLINRILEVSRLETQMGIRQDNLDLNGVLEDVYRLMKPLAEKNRIDINLKKGETGIVIAGDKERLIELFTNIVDNAIKYSNADGKIDIELKVINQEAVISIADTGIGMPQEEVDRIFERFYRIDTSRGEVAGSGLGLSIAKALAEAHKGRIDLKSELGKGSVFTIYLPIRNQ